MGEFMLNKRIHQSGQTIIEVVIALSTAVVIVSAISLSILTALRNVQYTQTQATATRYAQEGMEFMRFTRDANYATFNALSQNTTYCLAKNSSTLTISSSMYTNPNCGDNVDLYSRAIVLEKNSVYCAPVTPQALTPTPVNTGTKVTVIISWTDSNCPSSTRCHQSRLESCLSDFTVVATPGDNTTPTPSPTP